MHTGKIAAAAAAIALAALIGQIAPAAAGPSDSNMAYVSRYVDRAAAALQQDQHDYHGHRVAALADISRARADIASALAYDNSHDRYTLTAAAMANASAEAAFERSQAGSDRNLNYVRTYLERAIAMLRNDNHDYGGYRVKAIADLEAARDQIGTALRQDVKTEQPGVASDDNIRYTRGYIQKGISMLQQDQRDYGGHRAAAVTAMQNADADLLTALRADHANESVPTVNALALPAGYLLGQHASNQNIAYARVYVEHAIDMLQHDQHDYNGYRAKSVQQLQVAHAQLIAALQYR
jgi:protein-tyrosine-phosphatase